jgi:hypothetical protein
MWKDHFYHANFLRLWSPAALPPWLQRRGAIKPAWLLLRNLHPPARYPSVPLPPSLWLKRGKNRETDMKESKSGSFLAYKEVVSLSIQCHGGVGLACVRNHGRAPAKSCKSRVHVGGRASYLSCSCRSCVSHPGGGICHSMLVVLQAWIWCAFASIPSLAAAVLWLRATTSDSFVDFAHCGLRNPV